MRRHSHSDRDSRQQLRVALRLLRHFPVDGQLLTNLMEDLAVVIGLFLC